jgi:hypothetical protein
MKTKSYKNCIGYYSYNSRDGCYSGYIQKKNTNILSILRFYGVDINEMQDEFEEAVGLARQFRCI